MLEITKAFANVAGSSYDRPFNLEALGPWSENIAKELAEKEGITLTPAHWEVIEACATTIRSLAWKPMHVHF